MPQKETHLYFKTKEKGFKIHAFFTTPLLLADVNSKSTPCMIKIVKHHKKQEDMYLSVH
jgi:hypothetical protein